MATERKKKNLAKGFIGGETMNPALLTTELLQLAPNIVPRSHM